MELHSITAPAGTRFASWSRRMRCELVWAYKGAPRMLSGPSRIRNPAVWRILQGSVTVTSGESMVIARGGDWLAPGTRFHQRFSKNARIISIHFSCQWMTGKELIPRDLRLQVDSKDFPRLDERAQALVETITKAVPDAPGCDLAHLERSPVNLSDFLEVEGAFFKWFSCWMQVMEARGVILSETPGIRSEILRAIDYIRRLPYDAPFKEEDVVHVAGLSRSSLLSLYGEIVGMTPREHYDYLKLQAAETALQIGDGQIKTLAFELGFNSPSQFSNWFRRRHGMSPREYREQRQTSS